MRLYLILLATITIIFMYGCTKKLKIAAPVPAKRPDSIDLKKIKPNELGKVMVLEYHRIGPVEARWTRTPENFRKDLQRLYTKGYRPVSLTDYLDNRISVPAGFSPVILTFDDASRGQFNYIIKDGKRLMDPDSAVGILEEFNKKHPDFGLKATFYVLYPAFGQPQYSDEKIRYIIEHGMEVGNHTWNHSNLSTLPSDKTVQDIALPQKKVSEIVKGYRINSIALPYGEKPKDIKNLVSGNCQGTTYKNRCALLVGAEPAPSAASERFSAYSIPRIQGIQSELDMWFAYFDKNKGRRFVSDGDPDIITFPAAEESSLRSGIKNIRIY